MEEMYRARNGKGLIAPMPSPSWLATVSPNAQVFTNPEALSTPFGVEVVYGGFTYHIHMID